MASNAEIKPSLGRDLAAGAKGVATIVLIEPNTVFEDRVNQLDFRLTRTVRVGHVRIQGMFDVYNVLNSDAILADTLRFGANFLKPTSTLGARLFKFGAQLNF